MKKKLQNIVEKYDNGKFSLDELIYRLKIYDREQFKIKTKSLIKELHPALKLMFWDFIKKVEDQTNFVYAGIYNGLEGNTNLKHYHIKFQHGWYFEIYFDFCYGIAGSSGSGKQSKYYVDYDEKIHMGACDGSAEFVYGEFPVDEENLMKDLFERIMDFNESIERY
jgi:hypothetical protein